LSELNTVLYNLVDTQFAAFVTGQADVSKDWDKYLGDLKNDGLDEFLQIYQTAYDAKYKK
jgi:putative aldouronate transport system substrate-binding protein